MSYNNVTGGLTSVVNGSNSLILNVPQDSAGVSYTYQIISSPPQELGVSARPSGKRRIGPKLYFSYVKSKLTKTQTKNLKSRLTKLQAIVKNADENGQKALYEETSRMLVIAIRESEAVACGFDVYINQKDVDRFRYQVTENDESTATIVYFKTLEEFPRPLPAKVSKVVKSVRAKGLFDELFVLYLDYSGEKIISTKEKIREKDPILFGRFAYDPEKLYFVTDWIDEYCDLTLSKFIDTLKEKDPEYNTSQVQDITPEYLEQIKQEMKERDERMQNVRPGNFREKMAEEDKTEINKLRAKNAQLEEKVQEPKKPWYKRLFK